MMSSYEDKINKDCWVKKTEYRFFGKKVFECLETCDHSNFQKPQKDNIYLIPKCFQEINSDNNSNKRF